MFDCTVTEIIECVPTSCRCLALDIYPGSCLQTSPNHSPNCSGKSTSHLMPRRLLCHACFRTKPDLTWVVQDGQQVLQVAHANDFQGYIEDSATIPLPILTILKRKYVDSAFLRFSDFGSCVGVVSSLPPPQSRLWYY